MAGLYNFAGPILTDSRISGSGFFEDDSPRVFS